MTYKTKDYDFDSLEETLKQRAYHKAAVVRLLSEVAVMKSKLAQLEEDLAKEEAAQNKEERRLKEVLADITK